MRVALLTHTLEEPYERLALTMARALQMQGIEPHVISSRPGRTRASHDAAPVTTVGRLPEFLSRRRGFTSPLTHGPLLLQALERGSFDVVHALRATDGAYAIVARRRTRTPVVFTAAEPVERATLSDTRLRLRIVTSAFEESDALTAPDPESARQVERWLALTPRVVDPDDGAAHEQLYRELIGRRSR